MSVVQVLSLLLALSCALNLGGLIYATAHRSGMDSARALLVAAGGIGTIMTVFFAAITAYR